MALNKKTGQKHPDEFLVRFVTTCCEGGAAINIFAYSCWLLFESDVFRLYLFVFVVRILGNEVNFVFLQKIKTSFVNLEVYLCQTLPFRNADTCIIVLVS